MMSFLGLTPDDYAQENTVLLWPDNEPAVRFVIELGNGSWNMGPNGPVGFRPEAFREARLALRVKASEWSALRADVRVIEDAALEAIHKE